MSLFDRLRPSWKHSDPAIRLAAGRQLGDQAVLEALVENDPSEEVRRAALHVVTNQDFLASMSNGAKG